MNATFQKAEKKCNKKKIRPLLSHPAVRFLFKIAFREKEQCCFACSLAQRPGKLRLIFHSRGSTLCYLQDQDAWQVRNDKPQKKL
jgi:hypothetical protein